MDESHGLDCTCETWIQDYPERSYLLPIEEEEMPELYVFEGENDWVVAESYEDATAVLNEQTGDNLIDYGYADD